MVQKQQYSWSGSLNWRALAAFDQVLVRRSADTGEWVIGMGVVPSADPFGNGYGAIGHLSFNYADATDRIQSRHVPDGSFAEHEWWAPELLVQCREGTATEWTQGLSAQANNGRWRTELFSPMVSAPPPPRANWQRHTPKERYLRNAELLLHHIQQGDIYEVNYCTERSAMVPGLDPFDAFERLLRHTDAPYAALYKRGHHFALCMSPERYLRIEGRTVTTQPMKGTRKRGASADVDVELIHELTTDAKERSENIMAVDVARHDLSRVAASRSVHVPELCAVKTYPHVHQMVSTVRAELREGLNAWDAVRATFPMASMTGAPKLRALQLIDQVEEQPRGLFSGALGYQLPDGTMDLNVVIRTITYNASTGRASLITGSAITALSDPAAEWEECELKARSVLNALGHVA